MTASLKSYSAMDNILLFSEKQRFKQIGLWIMLLALNGMFLFGFIKQVVWGVPFGTRPLPTAGLLLVLLLSFLISFLLLSIRLETRIQTNGIYVRLFPLQRTFKQYPWEQLSQVFIKKYQPLREFGGWGIRGSGKNRALSISGNKGIQLVLHNGSKLLIGTQKEAEVAQVLAQLGFFETPVL